MTDGKPDARTPGQKRVDEIRLAHSCEMESPLLGDNKHYDEIGALLAHITTLERAVAEANRGWEADQYELSSARRALAEAHAALTVARAGLIATSLGGVTDEEGEETSLQSWCDDGWTCEHDECVKGRAGIQAIDAALNPTTPPPPASTLYDGCVGTHSYTGSCLQPQPPARRRDG